MAHTRPINPLPRSSRATEHQWRRDEAVLHALEQNELAAAGRWLALETIRPAVVRRDRGSISTPSVPTRSATQAETVDTRNIAAGLDIRFLSQEFSHHKAAFRPRCDDLIFVADAAHSQLGFAITLPQP